MGYPTWQWHLIGEIWWVHWSNGSLVGGLEQYDNDKDLNPHLLCLISPCYFDVLRRLRQIQARNLLSLSPVALLDIEQKSAQVRRELTIDYSIHKALNDDTCLLVPG